MSWASIHHGDPRDLNELRLCVRAQDTLVLAAALLVATVSTTARAQQQVGLRVAAIPGSGPLPTNAELPSAPEALQDVDGSSINLKSSLRASVEAHSDVLGGALVGVSASVDPGQQTTNTAPINPRLPSYDPSREDSLTTLYKSSSYVPLDSWIYPAIDRLAALGYIQTGTASVRPLTRLECARLLAEAHGNLEDEDATAETLIAALDKELAHETSVIDGGKNTRATAESAYTRITGIAGTPLRDAFHFGQTLDDDNGRPYGGGANSYTGLSGHGEAGPLSFYIRGEYQYASAIPAYSTAVQQTIALFDEASEAWTLPAGAPLPPNFDVTLGTTNRVRTIEAYASVNVKNWQISFGQQNLWWGPDRTTSLILSNNAEALPMLRFARVKPIKMPSLLGWLGPVHFDSFFAREGGIHYVALGNPIIPDSPIFVLTGSPGQPLNPPPYMWGVTFSFQPTKNFEIGFSHTTIFAGLGRPLNLSTFFHSFSIAGNGQAVDPGKRATQFNLYYHLPGLRKSVIVYTEGLAWDDPVEGSFLERFAMDPGIYLPQLPRLKKLDLRMEGVYTDLPGLKIPAYFYGNTRYAQGYTNYGQIMGSWTGRQGRGGQATSTYWFSARTKAAVSYRKMTNDKALLQGGNLDDVSGSFIWTAKPGIEFSATGQYEHWKFPLLATGVQSNFATTFQIKIFPKAQVGSK